PARTGRSTGPLKPHLSFLSRLPGSVNRCHSSSPMHSSPRIQMRLGRLAVAWILGARALCGQSVEETELILQHLQTAAEATDYRAVLLRRVRALFSGLGRGGEGVGAIESVMHRGAAAGREEQFSLELRGFEGVALSVPELAQRQVLYQSRAANLYRYQSFRVLDARAAAQQYVVVALGEGAVRAGRYCNRIAVV